MSSHGKCRVCTGTDTVRHLLGAHNELACSTTHVQCTARVLFARGAAVVAKALVLKRPWR